METPKNLLEEFDEIKRHGRIPSKSRPEYYREFNRYKLWKQERNIAEECNSEEVVGLYIEKRSKEVVPPSLFTILSFLKATIAVEYNSNIPTDNLQAIIARKQQNYQPKQATVLTPNQIGQYLKKDNVSLIYKVIAVLGFCGGLRKVEMHKLKYDEVKINEETAIIKVKPTKTNKRGTFAIAKSTDTEDVDYLDILKKYYNFRSKITGMSPFLLQIRNNKCTKQRVGAKTLGSVPSHIAMSLTLPNPELYTGHSLRRSSATALVETGADILTLKRHGRWQSDAVAERYVSESVHHQVSIAKRICYGTTSTPSTSSSASTSGDKPNLKSTEELGFSFGTTNTFYGNISVTINK